MIHFAEAVLPGHPDKFCDRVADAIVAAALQADPEAFAQIEVGVWSDEAWLSGTIVSRQPLAQSPADILVQVGLSIGLNAGNHIDATRYNIKDVVCQYKDDPSGGRKVCDDQSIVIGYAGYNALTRYLPPEQFAVHTLAAQLWRDCCTGVLQSCGPDGKLLITLREEGNSWVLEKVLVTLQHPRQMGLIDMTQAVHQSLQSCYEELQAHDARWCQDWRDVQLMVNPNGPLWRAGSDGDNGQTGRKLVMDYYGPRVAIGGGALAGKHPAHIDRMAARSARNAAVHAVQTGALACTIRLAYAPNTNEPLQEIWEMGAKGERPLKGHFNFDAMLARTARWVEKDEYGMGIYSWALPDNGITLTRQEAYAKVDPVR